MYSCLPDRHVSEKFSRSRHRPSLITSPRFARPVPSKPVKQWSFRKAKWSYYITLTNKRARALPPPDLLDMDQAYQCFCNAINTAAKKCIPRGRRNNRIPCWDADCKNLYQKFLQCPEGHESSRADIALLARLDRKRRDRWPEAVQNIDFSHSSRVAWSTLNNLTGWSRQSPRQCLVSANAIASQLVKDGKYEGANRKISRFVLQELSDFCRTIAPDAINIFVDFSRREFSTALHHLKPGKAPDPNSICPGVFTDTGPDLKFWLRGLFSSHLRQLKIQKVWRRALVVAISNPSKPVEDPQSYHPISLLCVP